MSGLTHLKLGVAAAGLIVWGYGARVDDASIRWVGIALLALSFLVRFLGPRPGSRSTAGEDAASAEAGMTEDGVPPADRDHPSAGGHSAAADGSRRPSDDSDTDRS